MTIDVALFAEMLDELAGYYNKTITPFAKKAWYKRLGSQLTNQQFTNAVEQAITSKQFMPTAEELLELVKGNSEIIALDEWEKCLNAASRGSSEVVSSLSPAGKIALRAIGGFKKLEMSEEKDHQWLQKKFIDIYKSAPVEQRPVLPAAEDSVVLPVADIQALTSKMSMNGNGNNR